MSDIIVLFQVTINRTCALHETEFKDILLSDCFVDKSLIIKDFLNIDSYITRVTAPTGFDKTVNLKMLKAFLKADRELISLHQTESCRLFVKHNLNIFKSDNKFFYSNCGKYPVIFISFKKITGNTFEDVYESFKGVISDSFLEHNYLLNSTRLTCKEKSVIITYSRFYDINVYKSVTEAKVKNGLAYLSQMLYYYFNKKAIVLIDAFDVLLWTLLPENVLLRNRDKIIDFFKVVMFKFLVNNRYIEKCFINDCFRLSSVFLKKINGIVHLPFLGNHPLVKY